MSGLVPGLSEYIDEDGGSQDHPPQAASQMGPFAEYRGPLPPASEFAAYAQGVPDAPERILKMAESAQDRALAMQERQTTNDERAVKGAVAALRRDDAIVAIMVVGGLATGAWLGYIGESVAAATAVGGGGFGGGVIKVFLGRSRRSNRD